MRRILKLHRSLAEPVNPVAHNFHIITFDTQPHPKLWLEPHGFFLCVSEEKIVGFCWTKIHQDLVNKEPIGELYVIGVDPAHSGKGIGKALCTQGLIYLKNKGITQGMLYVDEDNEAGKGLYKTLGFN